MFRRAITLSFLLFVQVAKVWAAADQWQYPINNWNGVIPGGLPFGAWNPYFGGYHLAQDTNPSYTPYGTTIYAPAEGTVKFSGLASGYGSSACNGDPGQAGYVVVIEHRASSGVKVCSTLGHVQGGTYNQGNQTGLIPVGSFVQKGQYIGRVAHYWGCPTGDWHHLHFGIRKNGYAGGPNLAGYTPTQAGLAAWHEPNGYVAARLGTSCSSPGSYVDIKKAGDFNGDGKKEFARFFSGPGLWKVALSSGWDFAPLRDWKCSLGAGSNGQYVGDVTGDGRDDAVYFNETYDLPYLGVSTGSSFIGPSLASDTPIHGSMTNKFLADINGDGREDFVAFENTTTGSWYAALSNGSKFVNIGLVASTHGIQSQRRLMGDVNGDGRDDAIVFFNNTGDWWVGYAQPNGHFCCGTKWISGYGIGSDDQFLADANGDGKLDAVAFFHNLYGYNGFVEVCLSDGTQFTRTPPTTWTVGQAGGSQNRLVSDFTGDGRADFAFWYPTSGWYVAVSTGAGFTSGTPW